MGGILGPILGAATSLFGSLFGASNASKAQAQTQADWQSSFNLAVNQAKGAYLPFIIENAKKAGINPLAVLPGGGSQGPSAPIFSGDSGNGFSGAADALSRLSLPTTRDKLENELLAAQIKQVETETIGKALLNSKLAVATQAGVKPDGSVAHPFPADSWYVNSRGEKFRGVSQAFGQNNQGVAGFMPGLVEGLHLMGETFDTGWEEAKKNLYNYATSIRPDVLRSYSQPYYP